MSDDWVAVSVERHRGSVARRADVHERSVRARGAGRIAAHVQIQSVGGPVEVADDRVAVETDRHRRVNAALSHKGAVYAGWKLAGAGKAQSCADPSVVVDHNLSGLARQLVQCVQSSNIARQVVEGGLDHVFVVAVQERHALSTSCWIFRRKRCCRCSRRYAVVERPINRIGVVAVLLNVRKRT